jgi:hypothetical protein
MEREIEISSLSRRMRGKYVCLCLCREEGGESKRKS